MFGVSTMSVGGRRSETVLYFGTDTLEGMVGDEHIHGIVDRGSRGNKATTNRRWGLTVCIVPFIA